LAPDAGQGPAGANRPGRERRAVAAAAVLFAVSALALAVTVVTIPPHWSN
jgi:hypothetical protein